MRRKTSIILGVVGFVSLLPQGAFPCGICKEDDRAAVYSQEAMEKSQAEPDRYEFVVLKVTHGPLTPTNIQKIHDWLAKQSGVASSTVNVSQQQRSIGFLFDKQEKLQFLLENFKQILPDFTLLKRDDDS